MTHPQTYLGTNEDGTRNAVTITTIDGNLTALMYEDNAGSTDAVETLPDNADTTDYIRWLTTELGYQRTDRAWDVYTVAITCDRGHWTYPASHDPAAPIDDWARQQREYCCASPNEPWAIRVYDGATLVTEVGA